MDTNIATHDAGKTAQETGPSTPKQLKDLITDEDSRRALQVLRDLVDDTEAPRNLRMAAADSILDRKHGKAKQMIEQEVKIATFQDFIKVAREREAKYQQVLAKSNEPVIEAEVIPAPISWEGLI